MFDSEDHRLWQVNLIALLVNGCGDDRGVDDNRVIRIDGIAAQSDAGVLRGQVGAQVLVQDKHHPDLTCTKGTRIVHSIIVVKQWWQKFDTSSGWEKKIERHREREISESKCKEENMRFLCYHFCHAVWECWLTAGWSFRVVPTEGMSGLRGSHPCSAWLLPALKYVHTNTHAHKTRTP